MIYYLPIENGLPSEDFSLYDLILTNAENFIRLYDGDHTLLDFLSEKQNGNCIRTVHVEEPFAIYTQTCAVTKRLLKLRPLLPEEAFTLSVGESMRIYGVILNVDIVSAVDIGFRV